MDDGAIIQLFTDLTKKVDAHGRAARVQTMAEAEVINTRHRDLEKKVSFWIWLQNNPGRSITAAVIIFGCLAYAYHRVDVRYLMETKGIKVVDKQVTVVERPPIK